MTRKRPNEQLIRLLQGYLEGLLDHHKEHHDKCYAQTMIEEKEEYRQALKKLP